jgi:uncharacterized protein YbbC (DUF1343 family)
MVGNRFSVSWCSLVLLFVCAAHAGQVGTGLDRVSAYAALFQGRRVGILANQTACDRQGRFIVEGFQSLQGVTVTALYAPEHGLWGTLGAGDEVHTVVHPEFGIPVYSLYGSGEAQRDPVLDEVDVLVFDMQDIGARFYTYVSSMALAMKAAARQGIPFVVLDRPNPLGGLRVEGPVLDPAYASFVGLFPVPLVHGLTVGEFARLIQGEGWLGEGLQVDLEVVPLTGWQRSMTYAQTGLPFIKPSPNIPDVLTAEIYPGTALIEGTNVSEGRGTDRPFQQLGAPWINGPDLARQLNGLGLDGIRFHPVTFTPQRSKHAGQRCSGVRLEVTDRNAFSPVACGVNLLATLHRLYPQQLQWRLPHLDRLCGTDRVRRAIESGKSLAVLQQDWRAQIAVFQEKSGVYRLYR